MITFGVHAGLQATTFRELVAVWQQVERLGFDWISVWDHFYAADASGRADCLEAVSMHAALACNTTRVRCGCLVYSVGYRHPAVLANAIATIDQLSNGRADIGLGAGWHQVEYDAYGIPFPPAGVRLDQLDEAAQCVRDLLHKGVVDFEGRYFQLRNARCEPRPVQQKLPVWIGGGGERKTLRSVARWADGWNVPFVSPDEFARKRQVLHRHCEEVERNPAEIRCAVNVALAWRDEDLVEQFDGLAEFFRPAALTGSDEEVKDKVGRYVDAGADQLNIALRAPFHADALERAASAIGVEPAGSADRLSGL
ncbi:MAG TPA: TIGR03560 family F420-dependent LLM class oxidoreductase [Acidimicrobiia bacterium]|nr:TIGR03560 family F420-dependent LLM class oxidoreductase [Acidimicrobiia bacterium]